MLFACTLENASPAAAEKVYARLTHNFFDWNEVRVSTVTELAEVMKDLPEPPVAASNLKKILQGVFESTYSFDLEQLKKQNISAGIKRLQSLDGVTPFILAYTVQVALEGHSIPLDRGTLDVLGILGIASAAEVESGNVTGLERAIPKNKGIEFGSLLHQLGADYVASPHSPSVKKIITSINPQAVIPKRAAKQETPPKPEARKVDTRSAKEKAAANGDHKTSAKPRPELAVPPKSPDKNAKAEKPPAKPSKPEKLPEKHAKKIEPPKKAVLPVKKKTDTKQLAKRKPR
jgi:endonuclease-3